MSAQPSGEAVALVAAALRAEREVTVIEQRTRHEGVMAVLPAYTERIRKVDDATDALHAYIAKIEHALADISGHAENYVSTDTAHDDPAYAVHLMAQVIDALLEVNQERAA